MSEGQKVRAGTKYAKVLEGLRVKIQSGEYTGLLPGVQALGKEYEVNLMTANKAVNMLVDEGLLYRIPRQGTYVKRMRSHTMAALLPNPYGPLQGYLIHGVEGGCRATENHFIFKAHRDDPTQELEAVKSLFNDNKADGLVLWPCQSRLDSPAIEYLRDQHFPVVMVVAVAVQDQPEFSSVISDEMRGGELATQHLIDQGCKNIVCVVPDGPVEWTCKMQARRAGYRNVIKKAGLEPHGDLHVDFAKHGPREEFDVTPELIDQLKQYDGVFFFNDVIATSAMKLMEHTGMRIPEDIAVVGFDNIELAELFGISSVWQNFKQIGVTAAELLMKNIEDRDMPAKQIVLEPELIVRRSSLRSQE